jgi:hypothetical protein
MTIEIKQLIIRAIVDGRREHAPHPSGPLAVTAPGPARPQPHPATHGENREAIVATCVREVLRRLERSHER